MCVSSPDHHGTAYNDFERQTAAATGCGLTSRQDLTTKASGLTTAPSGWTWTTVARSNHRTAGPDASLPLMVRTSRYPLRRTRAMPAATVVASVHPAAMRT